MDTQGDRGIYLLVNTTCGSNSRSAIDHYYNTSKDALGLLGIGFAQGLFLKIISSCGASIDVRVIPVSGSGAVHPERVPAERCLNNSLTL